MPLSEIEQRIYDQNPILVENIRTQVQPILDEISTWVTAFEAASPTDKQQIGNTLESVCLTRLRNFLDNHNQVLTAAGLQIALKLIADAMPIAGRALRIARAIISGRSAADAFAAAAPAPAPGTAAPAPVATAVPVPVATAVPVPAAAVVPVQTEAFLIRQLVNLVNQSQPSFEDTLRRYLQQPLSDESIGYLANNFADISKVFRELNPAHLTREDAILNYMPTQLRTVILCTLLRLVEEAPFAHLEVKNGCLVQAFDLLRRDDSARRIIDEENRHAEEERIHAETVSLTDAAIAAALAAEEAGVAQAAPGAGPSPFSASPTTPALAAVQSLADKATVFGVTVHSLYSDYPNGGRPGIQRQFSEQVRPLIVNASTQFGFPPAEDTSRYVDVVKNLSSELDCLKVNELVENRDQEVRLQRFEKMISYGASQTDISRVCQSGAAFNLKELIAQAGFLYSELPQTAQADALAAFNQKINAMFPVDRRYPSNPKGPLHLSSVETDAMLAATYAGALLEATLQEHCKLKQAQAQHASRSMTAGFAARRDAATDAQRLEEARLANERGASIDDIAQILSPNKPY